MNRNIVLIGYMGSGKTTAGIRLSYFERQAFLDTDKLIEREQNREIARIFEEDGEAFFRDIETKTLQRLVLSEQNKIISTGGGMALREQNRELLRQLGTVVYLKAAPETVYERVKHDVSRPLLQRPDPLACIREMMAAREAAYRDAADVTVRVDGKDLDTIVREIDAQVGKFRKRKERAGGNGMNLLVINGPNLNFLGIREKAVYGQEDYEFLLRKIEGKGKQRGCRIEVFQSNHEGAIIDRIQEAYSDGTDGIIINPGAYTHYSYAIRDALASVTLPKVEVHISDITRREEFRKVSVTKDACDTQIYGHGLDGYLEAVDYILDGGRAADPGKR